MPLRPRLAARHAALLLALSLPGLPARALGAEAAAAPAVPAAPQVSGVIWADWFYNASGTAQDSSAFTFRRIYLTVDHTLDARFSARIQLEGDGQNVGSTGRMTVAFKQAHLRWKDAVPRGALVMGLSPSPLWVNEEALWGYRSIEKTALDVRGHGNSSELGVALLGSAGAKDALGYHVMVSNGSGQKPENNRSRRAAASVSLRRAGFLVESVADWDGATGGNDATTVKLLAGWSRDRDALGIEGFVRNFEGPRADPQGTSVFGRVAVGPRLTCVGRWDTYNADPDAEATGYFLHYFVLGLDIALSKQVHVLPNVLAQFYAAKSAAVAERDADVTPRVTLSCVLP